MTANVTRCFKMELPEPLFQMLEELKSETGVAPQTYIKWLIIDAWEKKYGKDRKVRKNVQTKKNL